MAKKIKEEELKEVKKTKKVTKKEEPKKKTKTVAKKKVVVKEEKEESKVVEALEENTKAVKELTEATNESTKMDKKTLFTLIGTIIGIVALCTLLFLVSNNRPAKESFVKSITGDEYLAMFTEKSEEAKVVVVGRASCSHCVAYKPVYTTVANEKEVPIYYLDTDTITDEEVWYAVWEYTGTEGTPTTVVVQNGENKEAIEGELSSEEVVSLLDKYSLLKVDYEEAE